MTGSSPHSRGSPVDNPLLRDRPDADPQRLEEWRQKVDAWTFGWLIEDAMKVNPTAASMIHAAQHEPNKLGPLHP